MDIIELKISKEVAASTADAETHTPAAGKKVSIRQFVGSAAFVVNCVVRLVWKYGVAGETIFWTINGDSKMPYALYLPDAEVDGVNKLAIVLDNGTAGPVYMSGFLEVGEE
jgi:hypothetical protein